MGRRVIWLGGMSGVGKTTAARRVARRYDLWLYSIDARTWKHAEAMQVPALTMSLDEMWLDRSPEQMAQDFLDEADERFALIKDEVAAIPEGVAESFVLEHVDGPGRRERRGSPPVRQMTPRSTNGAATPSTSRVLVSSRSASPASAISRAASRWSRSRSTGRFTGLS